MINLDPAVPDVPFQANIDIRDTVNYKEVMKQYNLGPNGGILTALNLFATRFDQVMHFIESRCNIDSPFATATTATNSNASNNTTTTSSSSSKSGDHSGDAEEFEEEPLQNIFIDTPGQIEIFTWSASGQIISESLASSLPTCIAYIIDTPRCQSPVTFMSNMLYACSIMYKSKLPMVIVFNKVDVIRHEFAVRWMNDFQEFQEALRDDEQHSESYSSSLAFSMSLVLDEFYSHLTSVGVSAMTGEGMDHFFQALENARTEYENTYLVELQHKHRLREKRRKKSQMEKFKKDHSGAEKIPWEEDDGSDDAGVKDKTTAAAAASATADMEESHKLQQFLADLNLEQQPSEHSSSSLITSAAAAAEQK